MKNILLKLLIALSSALLLILLLFYTDSFDDLLHIIRNAEVHWLAAGFFCTVAYWILDAAILQVVTVTMHKSQRMKDTVRVTMIGQFFHSITPFAGGGEPVQAYIMTKDGVPPGFAASIFAVKTLLHEFIIVAYAIGSFIFYGGVFGAKIPQFSYFFISGLIINTAFLAFVILLLVKASSAKKVLMFFCRILAKLKLVKNIDAMEMKIDNELDSFKKGALILKADRKTLYKLAVLQILQFTFIFSVTYFIQLAVEPSRVSFTEVIASQSIITLLSFLIPTPGAAGGVEGLSYLFYGMFFSKGSILPVIFIYRLLTYYSNIVFGGLFALFAPERPLRQVTLLE